MTGFITRLLSDTGDTSSKRFVLVCAGASLSVSVVTLSIAAIYGQEVSAELNAVATALAGLASVSYVGGRFAEKGEPSV